MALIGISGATSSKFGDKKVLMEKRDIKEQKRKEFLQRKREKE